MKKFIPINCLPSIYCRNMLALSTTFFQMFPRYQASESTQAQLSVKFALKQTARFSFEDGGRKLSHGSLQLEPADEAQMKRNNTENLNAKVSSYNFLIRL